MQLHEETNESNGYFAIMKSRYSCMAAHLKRTIANSNPILNPKNAPTRPGKVIQNLALTLYPSCTVQQPSHHLK